MFGQSVNQAKLFSIVGTLLDRFWPCRSEQKMVLKEAVDILSHYKVTPYKV